MRQSTTTVIAFAALAAALTCLAAPAARAQIVYDNGSFVGGVGGFNITNLAIADDFLVTDSLTFDAIRFYALDTATGLLPNFSGTLSWFVYDSVGRTPSATPGANILASGTVSGSAITISNTGQITDENNEVAQLDFNIPSQTLTTGTYWLRIKEGTLTSTSDFTEIFWADKNGAITGNGFRADFNEAAPTTWTATGTDTTFDVSYQLINSAAVVPEADSLALLLPALGVLGIAVRRKVRVN